MLLASAGVVWRVYGGAADRVPFAWLIAFSFYPSLLVTALGQQTTFALVGVAGFLWAQQGGRPFLSGVLLGLTLAKPQNLILLWAAVGAVELISLRWRTLAGLTTATAALSALALAPNPAVFEHYVYALTHYPPADLVTSTPGALLRLSFGGGLWITLVPLLCALLWLGWYVARHLRPTWDWTERLPAILFASYLASPHGWVYDFLVLLVPLLQAGAAADAGGPGRQRAFLSMHLGLTALCLALKSANVQEYTFVWFVPTLLLVWLWFKRRGGATSAYRAI
ncbi:MAG: glycosyltransferase 87 family protein [Gemmataceae bacterium]|nr:glycosyltransferase 87 family protein [Gemmataceae bacterium]MCI0742218.1 glycosyltransferase 87 family protein [Gemmataceae bacterium]